MKLITKSPRKALKPFLKQKPLRSQIDTFKVHLIALLEKISVIEQQPKDETEEHLKNNIRDFLRDTYYKNTNAINTKDKKDLVIHLEKETTSNVGVIIEAKRPNNTSEMVSERNANKKALHELILYYLNERVTNENNELKQLVITNINEWYIIDANVFDKVIYKPNFIKLYTNKVNDKKDNPWFYEEVSKLIDKSDAELPCVYFNIKKYEKTLKNDNKVDDKELIELYKILSPLHLLKVGAANDSNKLDKPFYFELLHIIGLEEVKEGSKNIIRRKQTDVNKASLIEMALKKLKTKGVHKVKDLSIFGDTTEERHFAIALELCITWINRILFLKLLEGQLLNYHKGNKDYCFLNIATIHDFDELFKLFHQVLAVNIKDRDTDIQSKYHLVPYLNSSLFEISELEDETITIDSLDNTEILAFSNNTILKEQKKKEKGLTTLAYLFQFLNAYDFASEGEEDIQEENKTIINASVLGTVFEKINGYKDGSIYTPAFITMYMCRESIRSAVIDKFNEVKGWQVTNLIELQNEIQDRAEANTIINNLKICDPAVGSGHFLVSALNELIAIKSELNILMDEQGKTLKDYEIKINNDELIIIDENDKPFAYNPLNKESNRVQKTLFNEKREIIENCLFGVDINPNSVKICRLRLWIELLKNAYYKVETNYTELETLPNIDINIKCGNSLISRFKLDDDLSKALKNIKYDIKAYRGFVQDYKNERNRDTKRELQLLIDTVKNDFKTELTFRNKEAKDYVKARTQIVKLSSEINRLKEWKEKVPSKLKLDLEKATAKFNKIQKTIDEIKDNLIYKSAFEWRFEFPEVLNDEGGFEGFDLVIGNPPYIRQEEIKHLKSHLEENYLVFNSSADILTYFFELGNKILKQKGLLSFIVSNKFFKASYGDKLRSFLINNTLLDQIIEFDKVNIFDEATVKVAIIQFQKEQISKTFTYVDVTERPSDLENFKIIEGRKFEQSQFTGSWIFQSESQLKIYEKIRKYGTALSDWDLRIYRGLLTGLNEAFLIDEESKNRLIKEDSSSSIIIKPLFRGRETEKFYSKSSNSYIIATFPSLKLDIESYPSIKNHLLSFGQDKLEQSGKAGARKKTSNQWFETQDSTAYWTEFEKPKIFWKRIGSRLRFCYDESGTYTLDSTCIATGNRLKYLVGVLNSKLIENELNRFAPKTGTGDLIISVQALSPLQVPVPTEVQEK